MMKFLNKLTALLVVVSFAFSGEAFSARNIRTRDDATRALTVKKRVLATRQNKARTVRASRTQAPRTLRDQRRVSSRRVVQTNRLERLKTTAAPRVRGRANPRPVPTHALERRKAVAPVRSNVRTTPINTAERVKTARLAAAEKHAGRPTRFAHQPQAPFDARHKEIKSRLEEASRLATVKKRAATTPVKVAEAKKTVARARVKTTPTPVNAAKGKKAVRPVRPTVQRNVTPTPTKNVRRPVIKERESYILRKKDIPQKLREDLGALDLLDEDESHQFTPFELRLYLSLLTEIEKVSPGITERHLNYFITRGYNPHRNNDINIDVDTMPRDLRFYAETVLDEDFDDVDPFSMSSADITRLLNHLPKAERAAKGITQRTRAFLELACPGFRAAL